MKSLLVSMILLASVTQANAMVLGFQCKSDPSQSFRHVETNLSFSVYESDETARAPIVAVQNGDGVWKWFGDVERHAHNNFGVIRTAYTNGKEFNLTNVSFVDEAASNNWTLSVPSLGIRNEPMVCN